MLKIKLNNIQLLTSHTQIRMYIFVVLFVRVCFWGLEVCGNETFLE